jgi:nucleotide-binding universal stress UspA family protein
MNLAKPAQAMTRTLKAILENHDTAQCWTSKNSIRFVGLSGQASTAEQWRNRRHMNLRKVLVPVDFTTSTVKALQYSRALASLFGNTVRLLHVVEFDRLMTGADVRLWKSYNEILNDAHTDLNRLAQRYLGTSVSVETQVVTGRARLEILGAVRKTDIGLVILTTHGLQVWRHVLRRSIAQCALRGALCPVLLLHCPKPMDLKLGPDSDEREQLSRKITFELQGETKQRTDPVQPTTQSVA